MHNRNTFRQFPIINCQRRWHVLCSSSMSQQLTSCSLVDSMVNAYSWSKSVRLSPKQLLSGNLRVRTKTASSLAIATPNVFQLCTKRSEWTGEVQKSKPSLRTPFYMLFAAAGDRSSNWRFRKQIVCNSMNSLALGKRHSVTLSILKLWSPEFVSSTSTYPEINFNPGLRSWRSWDHRRWHCHDLGYKIPHQMDRGETRMAGGARAAAGHADAGGGRRANPAIQRRVRRRVVAGAALLR